MEEIWKEIEGYEGLYEVSNQGRVRSVDRSVVRRGHQMILKGKVLRPGTDRGGYHYVTLCKGGKWATHRVHRLVAEAFISNPDNKREIDHINTCRTDNRIVNLRWCTHKENSNNSLSIEKQKSSHKSKPVAQYSLDGELIAVYPSIMEAARQTGGSYGDIYNCCKGGYFDKRIGKWSNITKYKGYVWKYYNEEEEP